MKMKPEGIRSKKSKATADSMEGTQLPKKHLMNPKREMKQKTMKMKVGSAASKIRFIAWRCWSRNGKSWVQNLCSAHQSTWKKAGIYDAIMASKYPIKRQDNLILELASRWCSKTNTFIFPWGEATITLEDVMVLGGFSVTGVTTLKTPKNDAKLLEIEERLQIARKEIQRGKSRKASQSQWMMKFMEKKCDIEHEAFLLYWLSRFVFPVSTSEVINRKIFHIAIQLSRGIKFALARPVLGMLYKELTAMNIMLMGMASVSGSGNNNVQLDVFALFHIVQIWAWERLPLLKPEKSCMNFSGDLPRVAKWSWSNMKILKDKDLSSAINLAEESFVWCPYGESDKIGGREAKECFVQCVKTSKFEGFHCVEKYLPQRVARQFGLVQDIPTDHGDELTKQINSFKDDKLYVTSRRAKPTVTPSYQNWWKQQHSSSNSIKVKMENIVDYGPPPGFPPRIQFITISDSDSDGDDFNFSDEDFVFSDEEDALASANTSLHDPATQIGSESTFSVPSSFSDNESIEGVEFPTAEHLSCNGDKQEESKKHIMHPASTSKTVNIKREDFEEQENVPCGVIAIDDSSEDEHPFTQPEELPKRLDFMNKLTEKPIGNMCRNCTGSKQDSRNGTEAIAPGSDEAVSAVPRNEIAMNFDAESFTNKRASGSKFNLEARISKLEKIVFEDIGLGA
ncbi:hypothetical protein V2J09_008451 [Rumex salicifolius]